MESVMNNGEWTAEKEEKLLTTYPLHYACRDGDVNSLRQLLDERSDHLSSSITSEDCYYGWTPAHWAAYFGKLACLRKLSCHDRPANLKCDMRNSQFLQTPSHLAAYAGHPHCLQWLMQSQASINAQDYLGETPLHKAARTGSMECVSLLVSYQSNFNIQNHKGQTASQLARLCGFPNCATYLEHASSVTLSPLSNMETDDQKTLPSQSIKEPSMTDILMDHGVMQNSKLVGGRKRSREDLEEGSYKKLRQTESDGSTHVSDTAASTPTTNNSVLNSFNAVLSISTEPLRSPSDSAFGQLSERDRSSIPWIFI